MSIFLDSAGYGQVLALYLRELGMGNALPAVEATLMHPAELIRQHMDEAGIKPEQLAQTLGREGASDIRTIISGEGRVGARASKQTRTHAVIHKGGHMATVEESAIAGLAAMLKQTGQPLTVPDGKTFSESFKHTLGMDADATDGIAFSSVFNIARVDAGFEDKMKLAEEVAGRLNMATQTATPQQVARAIDAIEAGKDTKHVAPAVKTALARTIRDGLAGHGIRGPQLDQALLDLFDNGATAAHEGKRIQVKVVPGGLRNGGVFCRLSCAAYGRTSEHSFTIPNADRARRIAAGIQAKLDAPDAWGSHEDVAKIVERQSKVGFGYFAR